jgi:DnaK suppressor protein
MTFSAKPMLTTPPVALTPEQIEQLRQELVRTLARLERSVKKNGIGNGAAELDQTCVGRLSRIEALQNQGLTDGLRERERIQFEQVLDALCRLEGGTYGTCVTCHTHVAFERLTVFPETPTCSLCGQ